MCIYLSEIIFFSSVCWSEIVLRNGTTVRTNLALILKIRSSSNYIRLNSSLLLLGIELLKLRIHVLFHVLLLARRIHSGIIISILRLGIAIWLSSHCWLLRLLMRWVARVPIILSSLATNRGLSEREWPSLRSSSWISVVISLIWRRLFIFWIASICSWHNLIWRYLHLICSILLAHWISYAAAVWMLGELRI